MSEPGAPPPPPPYNPPPPSPPPPTGTPGSTVSPNRSVMIVLSYLWILFIVPMIAEKDDPEVQWHAKHGLVLTVAELIAFLALLMLQIVLSNVSGWGGGCGCFSLTSLGSLAFLVVRILAIMKGVNGQRFIIPGISDFASRF
ncbi:MAG TPA: hypothetical protein VF756_08040 [Thermoanaerobaculia bacterium]